MTKGTHSASLILLESQILKSSRKCTRTDITIIGTPTNHPKIFKADVFTLFQLRLFNILKDYPLNNNSLATHSLTQLGSYGNSGLSS